jgi:hypothetical protein
MSHQIFERVPGAIEFLAASPREWFIGVTFPEEGPPRGKTRRAWILFQAQRTAEQETVRLEVRRRADEQAALEREQQKRFQAALGWVRVALARQAATAPNRRPTPTTPHNNTTDRAIEHAHRALPQAVAFPPEGDIGGPRVTAHRVGADPVHVAGRELTRPDGAAMFQLLPASADHPSRRGRSVRSRSVRECSRRTGPPARHVFLPSAYPTGPSRRRLPRRGPALTWD